MIRLEQTVRQVMAEIFEVGADTLSAASSVSTIDTWDSLRHMQLIVTLEDRFHVRFSEEKIAGLTSLHAIVQALDEEFNKGGKTG